MRGGGLNLVLLLQCQMITRVSSLMLAPIRPVVSTCPVRPASCRTHPGICNYRNEHSSTLSAKPKRGSAVDSYQTVSVNCSKCRNRLFRYKKKNGTKSNLVKCFVERISEDSSGVLEKARSEISDHDGELPKDLPQDYTWECPSCNTQFARSAMIKGLPALKLVGGKVKMTKK